MNALNERVKVARTNVKTARLKVNPSCQYVKSATRSSFQIKVPKHRNTAIYVSLISNLAAINVKDHLKTHG